MSTWVAVHTGNSKFDMHNNHNGFDLFRISNNLIVQVEYFYTYVSCMHTHAGCVHASASVVFLAQTIVLHAFDSLLVCTIVSFAVTITHEEALPFPQFVLWRRPSLLQTGACALLYTCNCWHPRRHLSDTMYILVFTSMGLCDVVC